MRYAMIYTYCLLHRSYMFRRYYLNIFWELTPIYWSMTMLSLLVTSLLVRHVVITYSRKSEITVSWYPLMSHILHTKFCEITLNVAVIKKRDSTTQAVTKNIGKSNILSFIAVESMLKAANVIRQQRIHVVPIWK